MTRDGAATRRTVLERLAATTDAGRRERTTVAALATALDADEATVESHLSALAACELARLDADGRVRVTVTGEELLALDAEQPAIVDTAASDAEPREL